MLLQIVGIFLILWWNKRPTPRKINVKKAKWLSGAGMGGVGGGLTNSCEKKRSEKQRRKGKI